MSTIVGNIVIKVQNEHPDVEGHVVASALAIICGAIICFIGLIRAGWIVDFIPTACYLSLYDRSCSQYCLWSSAWSDGHQ